MSFDVFYPKRKDWRKPYYGAKSFSRGCRNHGSCPWCKANILHKSKYVIEDPEEYLEEENDGQPDEYTEWQDFGHDDEYRTMIDEVVDSYGD